MTATALVPSKMVGAAGTDGPASNRRSNTRDQQETRGFGSPPPDAREREVTGNDRALGNGRETSFGGC
jgi:hypothetical protein